MIKPLFFLCLALALFLSCQKNSGPGGNFRLYISADTIRFDTVFTSTGSVTQQVKLINPGNEGININSINLMGGSSSPFVINIDGTPGPGASGLYIGANDSMYIFVNVLIPPNNNALPFVLEDSIRINYNDVNQFIQLSTWGQNAHLLRNADIKTDTSVDERSAYCDLWRIAYRQQCHADHSVRCTYLYACRRACLRRWQPETDRRIARQSAGLFCRRPSRPALFPIPRLLAWNLF